MSIVINTPEGIAFAQAAARKGLLEAEIHNGDDYGKTKRGQTAYSIVKQVYGFRGSRQSVLEDLTEYIEATLRLRKLPKPVYKGVLEETQRLIDWLEERDSLSQQHFECILAENEEAGFMQHEQRQAMSDLFYVTIIEDNARNAGGR